MQQTTGQERPPPRLATPPSAPEAPDELAQRGDALRPGVLTGVSGGGRSERSAFLAILSHELRTPITTIYAGSRVLARSGGTSVQGSQEIAAAISAEAASLYDVVEDLLVLARDEAGVLDLSDEPVHLQRIVEGAIRIAESRAPSVPVVFAGSEDPPAVRGDAVYVEQVVRNLIVGSLRFAGPDRPVTVSLRAGKHNVILCVGDRGPNLTEDDLAAGFDLLDEPTGPRRSRFGIGLFVCRRLVEAMRGRISMTRRSGGGAEFLVALPRYATD